MNLKERIQSDLVAAMKARQAEVCSTLRMVKAAILNKEKESGQEGAITDDEVTALLQSLVKRRRESIEQYRAGNRPELADKEEAEIQVIQQYLPEEMGMEEIRAVVSQVISDTGATSPRELGKVMGQAMGRLKQEGKLVDGNKVREAASELLTSE